MKFKHIIGIDVSKSTLDYHILSETESNGKIKNETKDILIFFKKLNVDRSSKLVCLEHTGIYNIHLIQILSKFKFNVWIESALRIKRSIGLIRGKNDKIDAARIARYAYLHQDEVKLWNPSREIIQTLKNLLSQRARLIKAKMILTIPIEELKGVGLKQNIATLKKSFKASLAALEKDIKSLTAQIEKLIKTDDHINTLYMYATSVPNIGPITAAKMIVTTDEFKKIEDPKKFACHSGIAPFEHTSGSSVKGKTRVSHLADKEMKTMLHLAALSAISRAGEFKQYYERKVAEGKNRMLVINAIRCKLVHRVFACVKDQRIYVKKSLEMA